LNDLIKSPLWRKPPLYKQIYLWLQIKADHGGYKVLTGEGMQEIEPGQIVTTLSRIAEENSWLVRGKKKLVNKKSVSTVQQKMVRVESNSYSTLITLLV